jgi:hypothetical protein
MNRRTSTLGGLALILSVAAMPAPQAVDVTGAWKMTYTTNDAVKMSSTVTFKSENGALGGTIASPRGSVALNEVSLNGNEIAFAVIRVGFGDTIRIDYKGTVKGDTMTLKMTVGAREPLDVTAKRGE